MANLDHRHEKLQTDLAYICGAEQARQLRLALFKAQDEAEWLRGLQTADECRAGNLERALADADTRVKTATHQSHVFRTELRLLHRKMLVMQVSWARK